MSIARFSHCRTYRYTLWRNWGEGLFTCAGKPIRYVNFIMLNPSTADEVTDDRTISKCIKFSKSWGFDVMCVTNIFAYRSTDPKVLKTVNDPVGPDNDYYLENIAANAEMVIAAWSQYGTLLNRAEKVRKNLCVQMHYLRMGKTGPYHPLYLPDITRPQLWIAADPSQRSDTQL